MDDQLDGNVMWMEGKNDDNFYADEDYQYQSSSVSMWFLSDSVY